MKKSLLAAAIVSLFASANASAALIDLDTFVGWDVQDKFGAVPLFYDNTYTTSVGRMVLVTDLFVWGDEYQYYFDGVLQGSILNPASGPAPFNADPQSAYDSGLFANATFFLPAGTTLSFVGITIPAGFGDGTIAVRAGAVVPEPTPVALLGLALAGLALTRRRKQ